MTQHYPIVGYKQCSEVLNRTQKSIARKAEVLGLVGPGTLLSHEDYENKLDEIQSECFPMERYVNNKTPILHECSRSHRWLVRPKHVLEGRGCPTCSKNGFDPNKPAILYYIKITHENLTYYKIGVTNNSVDERFHADRDKLIESIRQIKFDLGYDALILEREILKSYPRITIKDFLKSGGNTELFETDVLNLA